MAFIFFSKLFQRALRRKDVEVGFAELQHRIHAAEQTVMHYNVKSEGYVDVRITLKTSPEQDEELKEHFSPFKNEDADLMALKVADYVNKIITYDSDLRNFGKVEYWNGPYEVWKTRRDDCDGYAALIMKAWGLLGIPADRRMVWVGDVFSPAGRLIGGHAVPIYLNYANNEWFAVEGSFNAALSRASFGVTPLWANKLYGRSWFVFNEERSYLGSRFLAGA